MMVDLEQSSAAKKRHLIGETPGVRLEDPGLAIGISGSGGDLSELRHLADAMIQHSRNLDPRNQRARGSYRTAGPYNNTMMALQTAILRGLKRRRVRI